MPYIPSDDRGKFQKSIDEIRAAKLSTTQMRKVLQKLIVEKLGLPAPAGLPSKLLKSLNGIGMNVGDINYFCTSVIVNYIDDHGKKYKVLNRLEGMLDKIKDDVVNNYYDKKVMTQDEFEELDLEFRGVIICCGKELYRVITGPYEIEKIEDPNNGPVVKDLAKLGKTKDY